MKCRLLLTLAIGIFLYSNGASYAQSVLWDGWTWAECDTDFNVSVEPDKHIGCYAPGRVNNPILPEIPDDDDNISMKFFAVVMTAYSVDNYKLVAEGFDLRVAGTPGMVRGLNHDQAIGFDCTNKSSFWFIKGQVIMTETVGGADHTFTRPWQKDEALNDFLSADPQCTEDLDWEEQADIDWGLHKWLKGIFGAVFEI